MVSKVIICPWEPIEEFDSLSEFKRFELWMAGNVSDGVAKKVPVKELFNELSSFEESWFEHIPSQKVWRLVSPDFPFKGFFREVKFSLNDEFAEGDS